MSKGTTVQENDGQETGLIVSDVNEKMISLMGFNPFQDTSKQGYESQDVEFFETKDMEGVEFRAILKDKIELEIKGEIKPFIRGYIEMANTVKLFHFGQHQVISTFDRNDKGKGVDCYITFEGKKAMKNSAKTLNHFSIVAKSL